MGERDDELTDGPTEELTDGPTDGPWDAWRAKAGELTLMPTFRFAQPHSVASDGRRIFVTNDGTLLCPHGEKASTICTWVHQEKVAERQGVAPPPRGSICDCISSQGLHKAVAPPAPLALPESLFDHLCAMGMPAITVHGRPARRVPFTKGERTAYLTTMGDLVCPHGRKRETLADKRWIAKGRACTCAPSAFPIRSALKGVRLGRHAGEYGRKGRVARSKQLW